VVCDGMGGMEFGDTASRTAARAFLDAYQSKAPEETIPDALERSVRAANDQVVSVAHKYGLSEGMGTTLIATALHETSLYFISVGDSGVFVLSDGQLQMINRPHVFANLLDAAVERGALSPADAENHPERESLTSFIGAESLDEIDRNREPYLLNENDVVLLASDGLFKTLSTGEILACLHGDPQSWPDALIEQTMAKHRDHQDNVTVLAIAMQRGTPGPPGPRARVDGAEGVRAGTDPMTNQGSDREASKLPTVTLYPPPAPAQDLQGGSVSDGAVRPVASAPAASAPPAQERPAPRSRGSLLIAILVAALVAGAGWWYFTQYRNSQSNSSPVLAQPGNPAGPAEGAQPAEVKRDPADPVFRDVPTPRPDPFSAPPAAPPSKAPDQGIKH
jgi:serine/threonine protein phosphatase PrpC